MSQTHKTIIFEEFDNTRPNLYTIINNNPSSDKLDAEIRAKLTVHNFNEFMARFAPKVYEACGKNPNTGEIEFFYTTDASRFAGYQCTEMEIGDHAYYKMLSKLYSQKGSSGKSNINFDDKEILEMLTPKKELAAVRDIRQKLDYNLKLFYEAKERGDKAEMAESREHLTECRQKIADYSKSSLNKLLPILIEDIGKKLELLGVAKTDGSENAPKALPSYGRLYLNEAGYIDVDTKKATPALAAPSDKALTTAGGDKVAVVPTNSAQNNSQALSKEQQRRNQIAGVIEKDYDKAVTTPNDKIKALVISAFAPLASNTAEEQEPLDAATLIKQRTVFENIYASARQSFATEMSKIVESLLGVQTFFDHATATGGEFSEVPAGVIIANCKASRLLNIKDKLATYMKILGADQGENRIWFAVLPNVQEDFGSSKSIKYENDDDPFADFDEVDADSDNDEIVSVNSAKSFLKIMEDAKILTVFNIRNKQGNTFADLTAAEVENKIKTFESARYGHAVYTYPNFTLLRERIFKPFDGQNDTEITLPGIFIDAAYPAAGLLVAGQQLKVFDNRKLSCDKESPCVRVDFEDVRIKKNLPTKFNRESMLRRSEELNRVIGDNMFGFVFSGDEVKDEDGVWQNSYVCCARTLAKNSRGTYKPIYQTLTEDYITQELTLLSSKKLTDVKKFITKLNKTYAERNGQNRYKDNVNLLLRTGEEIIIDVDSMKVRIHFNNDDATIEGFTVESD